MEKSEFQIEMGRLTIFKKPTDELLDAYWSAFQSWDYQDFSWCVMKILQDDERFPKIPRFRELMYERLRGTQKASGLAVFVCEKCEDAGILSPDFSVSEKELDNNGAVRCSCGRANNGNVVDESSESLCCKRLFPVQELKRVHFDSKRLGNLATILK